MRQEILALVSDPQTANWKNIADAFPHKDVKRVFMTEYLHYKDSPLQISYEKDWEHIVSLLGLNLTAEECKEHYMDPKGWLEREDTLLREAILSAELPEKPRWREVALRAFKGHVLRTGYACRHQFLKWMEGIQDQGSWSPAEDFLLQQAVAKHGNNWPLIALKYFPHTRDAASISLRHANSKWFSSKPVSWEEVGRKLNLSPQACEAHFSAQANWLPEEDQLLKETILSSDFDEGIVWSEILSKMYSGFRLRKAYDCRNRFLELMEKIEEPGFWTAEEDKILQKAISEHGMNWPLIALKYFPDTRTSNSCRSRNSQLHDPRRHPQASDSELSFSESEEIPAAARSKRRIREQSDDEWEKTDSSA